MKKILLITTLVSIILIACVPIYNSLLPQFTPYTAGVKISDGWKITATNKIQAFIIASNKKITKYNSQNICRREATSAGPDNALICKAPNVVEIITEGEPVTRVLESYATY